MACSSIGRCNAVVGVSAVVKASRQAGRTVRRSAERQPGKRASRSTTVTTTTSALLSRDTRIWLRGGRRQRCFAKQQPQPPHSSRRCGRRRRGCRRSKNKRSKPLMMAKPRSRSAGTAQAGRRRFRPISSFCHSLTACCWIPRHQSKSVSQRVRFDPSLLIMLLTLRFFVHVFSPHSSSRFSIIRGRPLFEPMAILEI